MRVLIFKPKALHLRGFLRYSPRYFHLRISTGSLINHYLYLVW